MNTNKMLKTPLKIIIGYLAFTLVLYVLGPFNWVTYHPIVFWLLNLAFLAAFIIGWNCGLRTYVTNYQFEDDCATHITNNLRFLITINFLYELINSFRRFRLSSFSVGTLLRSIIAGLGDMGGSYRDFQSSINDISVGALGGTAVTLFNLIWAFIAFNILILGIMYFKKLSLYNKVILSLTIALIVVEYIATGTNIGVFRILLIFVTLFFIRVVRGGFHLRGSINKKNKRRLIMLSIVAVIVALTLFDQIMKSRGGILLWQTGYYNVGGIYLNRDSVIFKYMPVSLHMLLIALSSYLCQGYYGMSLSLRIPWEPGYGVGHSMAIMNLLGDAVKIPHENTYQYRVSAFGWQEGVQWHTMYSWFANDISYIGVIFIMFIIGLVFSMAYRDAVLTNNPYAKLVTYYMMLLAVFIPCNNQLFQSTYTMFAFFTALFLWLTTRGRKQVVFCLGGKRLW